MRLLARLPLLASLPCLLLVPAAPLLACRTSSCSNKERIPMHGPAFTFKLKQQLNGSPNQLQFSIPSANHKFVSAGMGLPIPWPSPAFASLELLECHVIQCGSC